MVAASLWVIVSLVTLFVGADFLVKGSSSLAIRMGISPLVVGLTVVAMGTSTPELLVSIQAAMQGSPEIALGNAIGSNTFNIGIILGISALIFPLGINRQLMRLDLPILLAAGVLFTALFWDGVFGRVEGMLFFLALVLYTIYLIRISRKVKPQEDTTEQKSAPSNTRHWAVDLLFLAGGLAALVVGSNLLVDNSVELAHFFGLSESVIGLTIVAAGTGMPELATSVVAALKRDNDIAVGNVIGSCIYNLLAILGISATVKPIVAPEVGNFSNLVMVAFIVLLLPLMQTGRRINRLEGALLISCYVGYVGYLLW